MHDHHLTSKHNSLRRAICTSPQGSRWSRGRRRGNAAEKRLGAGRRTNRQAAAGMVSMRSPRRCRAVTPWLRASCSTLSSIEKVAKSSSDAESHCTGETAAGNCHLWMDECFNFFWVNTVIALYDEDRITIWGYCSRGCGKNSQPFSSRKTGSSE